MNKRFDVRSLVSSAAVQLTQLRSPTSPTTGLVPFLPVLPHDILSCCAALPSSVLQPLQLQAWCLSYPFSLTASPS